MWKFRAVVQGGRLRLDAPTQIEDGAVVDLVLADPEVERFERDRAEFRDATDEWLRQCMAGGTVDPDVEARMLRARAVVREGHTRAAEAKTLGPRSETDE